jgi:hypothetical protein
MDANFEQFNLYSILNHIKENIIGFSLLFLAFIIIVIVDKIARYNSMIYSIPSAIPGLPASVNPVKKKFKKQ